MIYCMSKLMSLESIPSGADSSRRSWLKRFAWLKFIGMNFETFTPGIVANRPKEYFSKRSIPRFPKRAAQSCFRLTQSVE
jgi:hypothetical protein